MMHTPGPWTSMVTDTMGDTPALMNGVTEYAEGYEVQLVETTGTYVGDKPETEWPGRGRLAIKALNEAGYNCTEVDLLEVLAWVKANRPDLMDSNSDDAALVTAAPDLLAESRRLLARLQEMAIHPSHYAGLAAAIARATGR